MKIFVFGAGKVGRALHRAFGRAGYESTLWPARKGVPVRPIDAAFIVLAIRDRDLRAVASDLAISGVVKRSAVVVHNAGALPAEILEPLRSVCAGVAQMHPMISFASRTFFPTLTRGQCHVKGDHVAETRARALAKRIGMTPRTFKKLDTVGYHAAAGLVANGAAALAAIGEELLVVSGAPRADAAKMLGPLLRSVAENVEALGFPSALTGPIRRGDAGSVERQIATLRERLESALPVFLACAQVQVPLARALREAPKSAFDDMERVIQAALSATKTQDGSRRARRVLSARRANARSARKR